MKTVNTYRRLLKLLFITTVLSFCVNVSFAQPEVPLRAITPSAIQPICFGTFCLPGSVGGTISVGCTNSVKPIATGGIVSLFEGRDAQPAIYAIKLCQGRRVKITFKETYLTCNGVSLKLLSGPSEYESSNEYFTTNRDCDFVNLVRVGGTLIVPNSTPPGIYVGEIEIALNQE